MRHFIKNKGTEVFEAGENTISVSDGHFLGAPIPYGKMIVWGNGNPSLEDIPEKTSTELEEARLVALEVEARAFRNGQFNEDERGLISTIELLSNTVTIPNLKPKAQANYDYHASIWALYHAKKGDASNTTTFESLGDKPFRFSEVREEA